MSSTDPHAHLQGNTDAREWARSFSKQFGLGLGLDGSPAEVDEEALFGWFANAIETGRSAGHFEGVRETVARELSGLLVQRFPLFAIVRLRDDHAREVVDEMLDAAVKRYGLGG